MAVSLVSTGIQFPDSTIQTTAASGGVPASYSAVGSLAFAQPTSSYTGTTYVGDTFAGTALRYANLAHNGSASASVIGDFSGGPGSDGKLTVGTWRQLSGGNRSSFSDWTGLFQRIS